MKLPKELQNLREQLQKESQSDKKLADKLRSEEMVNPWLITEIDYCGNPLLKQIDDQKI